MKNLILTIGLFTTLLTSNVSFSQQKRTPASFGRAEYVEVEKNVKLPLVLVCPILPFSGARLYRVPTYVTKTKSSVCNAAN